MRHTPQSTQLLRGTQGDTASLSVALPHTLTHRKDDSQEILLRDQPRGLGLKLLRGGLHILLPLQLSQLGSLKGPPTPAYHTHRVHTAVGVTMLWPTVTLHTHLKRSRTGPKQQLHSRGSSLALLLHQLLAEAEIAPECVSRAEVEDEGEATQTTPLSQQTRCSSWQ